MRCSTAWFCVLAVVLVVGAASSAAAASLDLEPSIAAEGGLSRQAREILDAMYPGTPPPEGAEPLLRSILLGLELDRTRALAREGRFPEAGAALAQAVLGVSWSYAPLEILQSIDGYVPPNPKAIPGDAAAAQDVAELRQDYRVARGERIRKVLEAGQSLSYETLLGWVVAGDESLDKFLAGRAEGPLAWDVLARAESADLTALLKGAVEAEATGEVGSARQQQSRAYLKRNLEQFTVFATLVDAARALKERFKAFMKESQFVLVSRFTGLGDGKPVEGALASFGSGLVGSFRTDAAGVVRIELPMDRLVRRLGGDGWAPLSLLVGRQELLYVNANLNSALAAAVRESPGSGKAAPAVVATTATTVAASAPAPLSAPAPAASGQGVRFTAPEQRYRVSRPSTDLRVKVLCDAPDGPLGRVEQVQITVSGLEPVTAALGAEARVAGLSPGLYLVSAAGKDAEGITIKTAAQLVTVATEAPPVVTLRLPGGSGPIPKGEKNLAVLVKALEDAKDRVLANELEVAEFRKVAGELFKLNREALGPAARDLQRSAGKTMVGLTYKSEPLGYVKQVEALAGRLDAIRKELPEKLTEGEGELRDQLIGLLSRYSSENFDMGSEDEHVYLAQYHMFLERAQTNLQELKLMLQELQDETRPAVDKASQEIQALLRDYAEKYQLAKWRVGLTHDADFHGLLVDRLRPLERLVAELSQLKTNDFLGGYERQVKELGRLIANREASLKVLDANLKSRLERYREHAAKKLDPLRQQLADLAAKKVNLARLAPLGDLAPFAEPRARVVGRQQAGYFKLLQDAAASPELQVPGASPPSVKARGSLPRALAALAPALELAAHVDRNQREGVRLMDDYAQLLRKNLIAVVDLSVPETRLREVCAMERTERRAVLNQEVEKVAREREPDRKLLLKDAPAGGQDILSLARRLLGLFLREEADRRVRDEQVRRDVAGLEQALDAAERAPGTSLAGVADGLGRLVVAVAAGGQGGLPFPRHDEQMGPDLTARLEGVKSRATNAVSAALRPSRERLTELAALLEAAAKGGPAPSEAQLAEARRLVGAALDPALGRTVEAVKGLGGTAEAAVAAHEAARAQLTKALALGLPTPTPTPAAAPVATPVGR